MSKIFGELPDMLKQQIIEYATPVNSPFILSYSPRTKTFIKSVNALFMCDTLKYKLNNPPEKGILVNSITIRPPPRVPSYTLIFGGSTVIMVNRKYERCFAAINKRYGKEQMFIYNLGDDNSVMFG